MATWEQCLAVQVALGTEESEWFLLGGIQSHKFCVYKLFGGAGERYFVGNRTWASMCVLFVFDIPKNHGISKLMEFGHPKEPSQKKRVKPLYFGGSNRWFLGMERNFRSERWFIIFMFHRPCYYVKPCSPFAPLGETVYRHPQTKRKAEAKT